MRNPHNLDDLFGGIVPRDQIPPRDQVRITEAPTPPSRDGTESVLYAPADIADRLVSMNVGCAGIAQLRQLRP
jgi:hypothetical protein